ncbi:hypothetical protein ACFYNZ_08515 [Streptomyces kebangsaanensis]|uniref:DUF5640 domain-containing protein n=1 Tax=Streptomyces kebangsaanensis TaxID=864058 RepID=A0ABW6KSZ0_9ACTN
MAALPLVFLVAFALLTACDPEQVPLRKTDVVGSWHSDDGRGRVDFHADGRFEMSGIPRSAIGFGFDEAPPGKGPLSGKGTWEFAYDEPSTGIQLRIEVAGSFFGPEIASLESIKEDGRTKMYFSVDVDKMYGYEIRRVSEQPQ